jgi:zinc protease
LSSPTPRLRPTAVATLDNGLTVLVRAVPGSQVVTSALVYRAGTRDEDIGRGGAAHFLEHMMFKGSGSFGPGEIDRRTQALGGSNNAFTSHDITAYHFSFAADRWHEALAIEADRMRGLTLAPAEVASERQVIVEEIAMYDDEPWDALEMAVLADFYGDHPYGRPVLGPKQELTALGELELAEFHAAHYRPDRGVLVVAGGVGGDGADGSDGRGVLDRVRAAFGDVAPSGSERRAVTFPERPATARRLERRHGEVPRGLWALAAPAADAPEHASLRVAASLLAGGRASRLHRLLVEERELALSVSADVHETQAPGVFTLGVELLPGVEPAEVEELVAAELRRLRESPVEAAELDRARRVLIADWVFGHEKVHQQALALGVTAALFDETHLERQMARIASTTTSEVREAAARFLIVDECSTIGWALPDEDDGDGGGDGDEEDDA